MRSTVTRGGRRGHGLRNFMVLGVSGFQDFRVSGFQGFRVFWGFQGLGLGARIEGFRVKGWMS